LSTLLEPELCARRLPESGRVAMGLAVLLVVLQAASLATGETLDVECIAVSASAETLWPASPPSLDRAEPNPQGEGRRTGDQTHRSGSKRQPANLLRRRMLAIALDRIREVAGTPLEELWVKLHDGWRQCGWSTLYRNVETGTMVGLPDHCDERACPYCEMRGVAKVRDRYRERHDQALREKRMYIVVLTIPNVPPGELAAALNRIRSAIGRMRRRRWWSDVVIGGLWRLEVTINLRERTWHPHANLLFETDDEISLRDWQQLLAVEWRSVLGEGAQQWIYLKPGWNGALPEAVKRQLVEGRGGGLDVERDGQSSIAYGVKPDPHAVDPSDPGWLVEYIEALAGRRAVSSFGGWRGLPKPKRASEEQLVTAPYAPGDDFFAERHLPELDPLSNTVASWKFAGRGPRWALRPFRPPGEGRQEWLVWHARDGTLEPTLADDDTPLAYQARLPIGAPARA
jgi:hypothetical protein